MTYQFPGDPDPPECGATEDRCWGCGEPLPQAPDAADAPYRPYCETCEDLLAEEADAWPHHLDS